MYFSFNNKNIDFINGRKINLEDFDTQSLSFSTFLISPINCINTLNSLNFLTPDNKVSCPIILENFTVFSKLKNQILQKDTSEPLFYSFEKKAIYFYENILNKKNQNNDLNSFSSQLLKNVTPEVFASVALLHEIGHAIHHALWAEHSVPQRLIITTQSGLNTQLLNSFINSEHVVRNSDNQIKFYHTPIKNHYRTIVQENFADIFAIIALNIILPDKKQALDLSEQIYEARKHAKNHNHEDYETYQNIRTVIDDLKKGKQFTNFESIQNYIAEKTSHILLKQFEQDINHHPKAKEEIPFYLGMINQQMKWNKTTLNDVVTEINQQCNLSCSLLTFDAKINYSETVQDMNNKFVQSQQQKMFLEKNTVIDNLQKIRQQALEPIASSIKPKI